MASPPTPSSRPPGSPRRRRVALLVESSNAYGRGLLGGVASYVRAHGNWSIQLPEMGRGGPVPDWLEAWNGDGILARIENEAMAAAVRAKGLPTIDLSAERLVPELPWVEVDEGAVGRLAVEHLRGRGFQNLAFCGDDRFRWSALRGNAFAAEAQGGTQAGTCSMARRDARPKNDSIAALAEWLAALPRPLGVFACFDRVGRELVEACSMAGLLVPEEVAVLGADDDELLCDLADPPLSSIRLNPRGAGSLAAELLTRWMDGEPPGPEGRFIAPLGVRTRRSTDVLAIEDPVLARALHFIHHHAADGIRVDDVVRAAAVSRRVLESRFRERLGRSPHEEILGARIERIRSLLLGTELSIAEIARRTGFRHVEYLTVAFKRVVGCTPSTYRDRAG